MSEYPIVHNTLEVDGDGFVDGQAFTKEKPTDEHGVVTVTGSVTSYEYGKHGETKMNHVPHIVVSNREGSILAEPHANDSPNPERVIQSTEDQVVWTFHHLDAYID